MKKIVVATTNNNKVNRLKKLLEGLDYELVSLKEVTDKELPEPEEKASTPVEIAIEKAIHYSKFMPEGTVILTQDDTIQFEGIDENDNPRLHIKAPVKEKYGKFTATHENTDIFIYPGFEFKAVNALITNFHLPKSTLIMLVSALSSKEIILNAYNEAVKDKYRFFSFGDAMFITDDINKDNK